MWIEILQFVLIIALGLALRWHRREWQRVTLGAAQRRAQRLEQMAARLAAAGPAGADTPGRALLRARLAAKG